MTRNGDFRILVALMTLILTLGILIGGYSLYTVYGIKKPVENRIAALASVSAVQIEKEKNQYYVEVKLGQVGDLQSVYTSLEEATNHRMAQGNYELKILDHRNDRLTELYGRLQPAIQQAIARQEYVWLDTRLSQETESLGMTYRLLVDEDNLYLQIADGSYYLYEIVERPTSESDDMLAGVQ